MGIMQTAYRTYEAQMHMAGIIEEGKEPLTPVSHAIQNAHIEIVLNGKGIFQQAYPVPKIKSKTIIPVTIESANRTNKPSPHPLCEQLEYLAPFGEEKFDAYLTQLEQWANSEFSHPKVRAVFAYIQGKTILRDLAESGVIALDDTGNPSKGKIENVDYNKCLVRWRVQTEQEEVRDACWEDPTLFDSYIAYYTHQLALKRKDICFISGRADVIAEMHPKGVIAANYGAKLASANDKSGFTFRGRFADARQAYAIGYIASQKAHHALRWIASNQGVTFGKRTFICWNPEGIPVPTFMLLGLPNTEPVNFVHYRKQLFETLSGYRQALPDTSDVVIAAFDAATTGRLSVTYYNELKGSDFFNRIEDWFASFCWDTWFGVRSPTLKQIVNCAFGTQRGNTIEADDAILPERMQQLLHCIIDKQPIPVDVVKALAAKASTPQAYTPENRERLLVTACAVIRKYRNDKRKEEEWTLALDTSNTDRSYLFGRLLAIMEQVEKSASDYEEGRETNAIRMQSVFAQRPMYAWRILEEKVGPYFSRLSPGLRNYYKNMIGEITDKLNWNDPQLGKKLDDIYLLGYYHQRSAMTRKREEGCKGGEGV